MYEMHTGFGTARNCASTVYRQRDSDHRTSERHNVVEEALMLIKYNEDINMYSAFSGSLVYFS